MIIERYDSGWPQQAIAESLGISRRTACKWPKRWRDVGESGLHVSHTRNGIARAALICFGVITSPAMPDNDMQLLYVCCHGDFLFKKALTLLIGSTDKMQLAIAFLPLSGGLRLLMFPGGHEYSKSQLIKNYLKF